MCHCVKCVKLQALTSFSVARHWEWRRDSDRHPWSTHWLPRGRWGLHCVFECSLKFPRGRPVLQLCTFYDSHPHHQAKWASEGWPTWCWTRPTGCWTWASSLRSERSSSRSGRTDRWTPTNNWVFRIGWWHCHHHGPGFDVERHLAEGGAEAGQRFPPPFVSWELVSSIFAICWTVVKDHTQCMNWNI